MKFRLQLAGVTLLLALVPCFIFRLLLHVQQQRVAQSCTTVITLRINADGTTEKPLKSVGCVDKDGNWFNPRTGEGF